MTKITYIPGEIANAAVDEHGNRKPVTRTQHIFDDNLEKPQSEVNQDRIEDVATLDGKIALEKQRAEGVESGLNNRLGTVEQLAEISIGGGDAQIATGADFTNPDATKRAKVPTVGAIVDGLNDGIYDVSKRNPTAGPNSDGKFTLDYILSNADTLIPTGWRHGGMIICFVDSSDNKYVQYRLMSDEWSIDTNDWSFCGEVILEENPEFMAVYTDKDGKLIKAVRKDGTELLAAGLEVDGRILADEVDVAGVAVGYSIDNPEFAAVWIVEGNRILFGVKKDGDFIFGAGVPKQIVEYIQNKIDELGLDKYGDIVSFLGNLITGDKTLAVLLGEKVDKEVGKSLIDGDVADSLHYVENEEYLSVKTDSEGKIIGYRDREGVLHENVGIITNSLNLTPQGMTDFQQALKAAGFRPGGGGDWSDYISNDGDNPLDIAIPRCAYLNLITDFNLVNLRKAYYDGGVKGVNYDLPIWVEFYDMQGNYFKKKAFISGQGRSTMARDKKNIAIDLFDSDWDDDAFSVRFGDWVPQDSFHLKAYVNETFNANGAWAYKIYDEMSKSWGVEYDYLWKRATLNMSQNTSVKAYGTTPEDNAKFEDTGAKCFPDGFPCIVYQNGEFWGVFAWQLKKHRDNYKMKKSEPKHIHLDGIINTNVWDTNGAPEWWTLEVRNPKDMVYSSAHLDSVTGKYTYKYNGDLSQDNLAGNQQWSSVHEYPIDYVVEWDGKRYKSLQNSNTGNEPSTVSEYWSVDSETPYDAWESETPYPQNKVIEHNGHKFINSVADNTAEPVINSEQGINTDKAPDFKNKTGCGWINCTNTIKVKNYIIDMSRIMTKIKEKEDAYLADTTAENLQDLKDTFETYFDVDNLVDYLIINDIINNADAFASNWQWLTYDGVKWWCGLYDCNISFGYGGGQYTTGDFRAPLNNNHAGGSSNYMMKYIKAYYSAELEARYAFLRSNKVVTAEKIYYDILLSWINTVGYVNYAKEREKWASETSVDNIFRLKKWVYETIQNLDALYHYSAN